MTFSLTSAILTAPNTPKVLRVLVEFSDEIQTLRRKEMGEAIPRVHAHIRDICARHRWKRSNHCRWEFSSRHSGAFPSDGRSEALISDHKVTFLKGTVCYNNSHTFLEVISGFVRDNSAISLSTTFTRCRQETIREIEKQELLVSSVLRKSANRREKSSSPVCDLCNSLRL